MMRVLLSALHLDQGARVPRRFSPASRRAGAWRGVAGHGVAGIRLFGRFVLQWGHVKPQRYPGRRGRCPGA